MCKEIYLMLTTACPNRCKYCYINHNQVHKSMTFEQCVDIIETNNPDRVIFFGGEPLLKIDLIEEVLAYYHSLESRPRFQIVTSTMANFGKFIEVHKKYPLDEIQLSFDGFVSSRINTEGHSIDNTVAQNIRFFADLDLKADISCVINEENVNEIDDIHKMFVNWKKLTKGKISGQFIIAHDPNHTDKFFEVLAEKFPKTLDLDKLYRFHLNNIIAYLQRDKNYANCDAGKYSVFTPDGRETFCTALSQEYGVDFSSELLQHPCTHKDCQRCQYKILCDGGCRYERYKIYGDNWENNYLVNTCKLTKIIYDSIKNFIDNLSRQDMLELYSIIEDYRVYLKYYHSEEETNV